MHTILRHSSVRRGFDGILHVVSVPTVVPANRTVHALIEK